MATADKLITVAENVPKVYHAGQLNVVENADCLKGSKTDTAILLDDISPVSHEMGVKVRGKNLSVDVSNRTDVYFRGSPTTTYSVTGSQIIKGFAVNGNATNYHITDFVNSNGTVTFKTSNVSYTVGIDVKVKSGFTYTVSANITGGTSENKPIWTVFLKDGVFQSYTTAQTFTVPSNCNEVILLIRPADANAECSFSNVQLELGTTATDYTPYVPDLTAVNLTRYGKNLFDKSISFHDTNHYVSVGGEYCKFKLYVGIGTAITVSLSKKYTAEDGKSGYMVAFSNQTQDTGDKWLFHNVYTEMNSKEANLISTDGYISLKIDNRAYKSFKDELQIEIGTTATDYESYITPTEYTPTADGIVEGVTSLYPNTTLMTDTEGVIIDCDYYKDVDKAFDALPTSVALSGGDT